LFVGVELAAFVEPVAPESSGGVGKIGLVNGGVFDGVLDVLGTLGVVDDGVVASPPLRPSAPPAEQPLATAPSRSAGTASLPQKNGIRFERCMGSFRSIGIVVELSSPSRDAARSREQRLAGVRHAPCAEARMMFSQCPEDALSRHAC
jgi:hypothetical protein